VVDVESEKLLITAIIEQAISDALAFKRPREFVQVNEDVFKPVDKKKRRKKPPIMILKRDRDRYKKEVASWDARRFICKTNKVFQTYSHLLGFDPDWMVEKIWKRIIYHDNLTRI
jgi:hypothetical protein